MIRQDRKFEVREKKKSRGRRFVPTKIIYSNYLRVDLLNHRMKGINQMVSPRIDLSSSHSRPGLQV